MIRVMPEPHRKRCKRYDIPGHAHCLTFSCFRQQPFFKGRLAPGWFCETIDEARDKEPFDLWAWVIMPEHVHLVLWPHPESQVSRILRFLKRPMTDRVLVWVQGNSPDFLPRMAATHADGRVSHHFWQAGGGYDRNLRSATDVHEKIDYIHFNPVRRGLVEHPRDWPWSSWRAWNTGANEPLHIDRHSVPPLV
jgi:putative transposase